MSTQHPDNVNLPFFAESSEMGGNDEVQEAFYVYSHLGCDEQMWDCEGKEVDNYVVKKILSNYESFFKNNHLGKDIFLTLRAPNPEVEKAEAKILLETLESIPRSFDIAKIFYGNDVSPIFEVILPMCQSTESIDCVYWYYKNFVSGKSHKFIKENLKTIGDWIGDFNPKTINVIPLFEDQDSMLNCHNILEKYLEDKEVLYQRVFLARSDPALNYGLVSATLLNKIALENLYNLSQKINIPIFPIVGVGSAPFRGNLMPKNVSRVIDEYPSVHTFSIQSSFKYDNPTDVVIKAIQELKENKTRTPRHIDTERSLDIIKRYSAEYRKQILNLSTIINKVAKHVPGRRKRKLHIGLFGYSRTMDNVTLPRAIKFTAALYSLGLPPELLGLNALTDDDITYLKTVYVNFENDVKDAVRYYDPTSTLIPAELKNTISKFFYSLNTNEDHLQITQHITKCVMDDNCDVSRDILQAAQLRGFLG